MDNFVFILRCISFALALFTITFLLLFRKPHSSTLLFAFFFFTFYSPVLSYIAQYLGLMREYPRLFFAPNGFYFFPMAIFYLYVKSLLKEINKKEIFLLCLPGIMEFCFMLTLMCLPGRTSFLLVSSYPMFFPILLGIVSPTFAIILLLLTLKRINGYQRKYLNFFSNSQKVNLNWVRYTCVVFIINYLSIMITIAFVKDPGAMEVVALLDSVWTIFYTHWIAIYGLKQSHIPAEFTTFDSVRALPLADEEEFRRIQQLLSRDKVYKNPNLTVLDIAERLEIPAKKVSHAINHFGNMNFNSFINSYRIMEAKAMLYNESYNQLTIEAIAKEAGFNSKSVFNTLFKKEVGQTPRNFKIQHRVHESMNAI